MSLYDSASSSDYDYWTDRTENEYPVLVITDLDKGGKSVTNNMEAVLAQIAKDEEIDIHELGSERLIIYRDSDGYYDAVKIAASGAVSFHPLSVKQRVNNEQDAIGAARKERKGVATNDNG
jgi:hypothetical protein